MSSKGKKLLYTRVGSDPVLRAVMADINMSAVKPDKGFLTCEQWAKKWKLAAGHQARIYLARAMKIGAVVKIGTLYLQAALGLLKLLNALAERDEFTAEQPLADAS